METIAPTVAETIMETVAATIPETIPTTIPPETIPKVIEVVETTDYTDILMEILGSTRNLEYLITMLNGFALFAVVVCLCYFCYKFFRIFF